MKVYLDDERNPPKGWTLVYTPLAVINLMKANVVDEISLDHDLGDMELALESIKKHIKN